MFNWDPRMEHWELRDLTDGNDNLICSFIPKNLRDYKTFGIDFMRFVMTSEGRQARMLPLLDSKQLHNFSLRGGYSNNQLVVSSVYPSKVKWLPQTIEIDWFEELDDEVVGELATNLIYLKLIQCHNLIRKFRKVE